MPTLPQKNPTSPVDNKLRPAERLPEHEPRDATPHGQIKDWGTIPSLPDPIPNDNRLHFAKVGGIAYAFLDGVAYPFIPTVEGEAQDAEQSTATVSVTTTQADRTGASITVTAAGDYLVVGVFDFISTGTGWGEARGYLVINSSSENAYARWADPGANAGLTIVQAWVVTLAASDVIKLQAKKTINAGTLVTQSVNTRISCISINGATGGGGSEPTADAHIADTSDAHDASAISIADAAGDFTATDVEGALAELQSDNEAHVAAADPHTGYRLESADHTHQSTGAQAGQLDHGLALTGLTDDDHTQYLLASAATDRATFAANWTDLTDGGATVLHSHAGGSGHTIRESGVDMTARTGLNFIDAGNAALVADDAGGDETEITLSGYALLAGRSGGQTLIGGTGASEILLLQSTSNATRGFVAIDGTLGVGAETSLGYTATNFGHYVGDGFGLSTVMLNVGVASGTAWASNQRIGVRINPGFAITGNVTNFIGLQGAAIVTHADTDNAARTVTSIYGLDFQFNVNNQETGAGNSLTATDVWGMRVRPESSISSAGGLMVTNWGGAIVTPSGGGLTSANTTITTYRGYHHNYAGTARATTFVAYDSIAITTGGTTAIQLRLGNVSGATNNYILELGSGPYLRLAGSGSWTAAANETPLWVIENATLRQLKVMDPGAGGANFAGGERVCILV